MSLPSMVQVTIGDDVVGHLSMKIVMILQEYVDPRDVKMNELEKVIAQYQDKLNDVTSNYQQKIGQQLFVKTFDFGGYRSLKCF